MNLSSTSSPAPNRISKPRKKQNYSKTPNLWYAPLPDQNLFLAYCNETTQLFGVQEVPTQPPKKTITETCLVRFTQRPFGMAPSKEETMDSLMGG